MGLKPLPFAYDLIFISNEQLHPLSPCTFFFNHNKNDLLNYAKRWILEFDKEFEEKAYERYLNLQLGIRLGHFGKLSRLICSSIGLMVFFIVESVHLDLLTS